MTKKIKHNPNSAGYTNALLENILDEVKAVHEAVQPIPKMQADINQLQEVVQVIPDIRADINQLQEVVQVIPYIQSTLDATFEEVGILRVDVEAIKLALPTKAERENLVRLESQILRLEQKV